jgi:hypothetical protein
MTQSCGEFVLSRITGEKLPVIRALLRRYRVDGWYDDTGTVAPNAVTAVLIDCGYRTWDAFIDSRKTVAECTALSAERYPGESVIGYIATHVFIMQDGRVYDEEFPRGIPVADAPYQPEPVELLTRFRSAVPKI